MSMKAISTGTTTNGTPVIRVTMLPTTIMEKIKYFFKTQWYKVKDIKFTKQHFKLWYLNMVASMCYFLKGIVGIATLRFFDPDITANITHKIAVLHSEIECDEFDKRLNATEPSDDIVPIQKDEVPEYIRNKIDMKKTQKEFLDKMAKEAEEEWYGH